MPTLPANPSAWNSRSCPTGGGGGGWVVPEPIPPLISSAHSAQGRAGELFTYQGTLSRGTTLEPCVIDWQISGQAWLSVDSGNGLVTGIVPPTIKNQILPFYLRAENCVGEDTIQVDIHVGSGVATYKIWLGNIGEETQTAYFEYQIFNLDNWTGSTNTPSVVRPQIDGEYVIYPPRSGHNEYQLILLPVGSFVKVDFRSRGQVIPMSRLQPDMQVQGQMYAVYRTNGRSAGGFTPPNQIVIQTFDS